MIDLGEVTTHEVEILEPVAVTPRLTVPATYRHHKDCGGVTHVDVVAEIAHAVLDGTRAYCRACRRNMPVDEFTWTNGQPMTTRSTR